MIRCLNMLLDVISNILDNIRYILDIIRQILVKYLVLCRNQSGSPARRRISSSRWGAPISDCSQGYDPTECPPETNSCSSTPAACSPSRTREGASAPASRWGLKLGRTRRRQGPEPQSVRIQSRFAAPAGDEADSPDQVLPRHCSGQKEGPSAAKATWRHEAPSEPRPTARRRPVRPPWSRGSSSVPTAITTQTGTADSK
jgi:hypothetical protein